MTLKPLGERWVKDWTSAECEKNTTRVTFHPGRRRERPMEKIKLGLDTMSFLISSTTKCTTSRIIRGWLFILQRARI